MSHMLQGLRLQVQVQGKGQEKQNPACSSARVNGVLQLTHRPVPQHVNAVQLGPVVHHELGAPKQFRNPHSELAVCIQAGLELGRGGEGGGEGSAGFKHKGRTCRIK